jgi:hypothetical protein
MGILGRLGSLGDNEVPFVPKAVEGEYSANRHDRYWLLLEMDSSFDGSEGCYSLAIENDGRHFVLKIPVDEVFSDPHDSHSLLEDKWKRYFGSDSQKAANWKHSNGHMQGKHWTTNISPTPSSRPTCVATVQARKRVLWFAILSSVLLNLLTKHFQCLILLLIVSCRPSTLFLISFSSSRLVKPQGHFTNSGASPTYISSASTLSPSSNCSLSPTRKISRSFQSPGA